MMQYLNRPPQWTGKPGSPERGPEKQEPAQGRTRVPYREKMFMRQYRSSCRRFAAAILGALLWLLLCGFTKAATYVGNEWAVNFWNSEMNTLQEDFEKIREDGFNAVVIVVPWRHFQPDLKSRGKNRTAYESLSRILDAAEANGLRVILRAGYTWDCYDSSGNVTNRYRKLRSDAETRGAWLEYLGQLYGAVKDHPAFGDAFLTWEDFWNFMDESAAFGTGNTDIPQRSGYSDWVFENYTAEEISRHYGTEITAPEELWFPALTSPARKFVLEWNDAWMNQLLADSQEVFPGISMEVRLDIDPVPGTEGVRIGVPHTVTFPAGSADFTSCMYAPTMGYQQGQELGAWEAVGMARGVLGQLRACAGWKPVFIDQFLFTDNTPGFEMNARVRPAELPEYIVGMAPVIESMEYGYAVWTYRDYADNIVVNGEFGRKEEDWKFYNEALAVEKNGNMRLFLPADGRAVQEFYSRQTATETGDILSFDYEVLRPCRLRVSAGHYVQDLSLEGSGSFREEMHVFGEHQIAFSCLDGEIEIDNVKVYSHVTEGGLYQMDGTEGPCLAAVRTLNARLPD